MKRKLARFKPKTDEYKDYRTYPKEGFPMRIDWKVIAPRDAEVSVLQDHDIVFDERDLRERDITPATIFAKQHYPYVKKGSYAQTN